MNHVQLKKSQIGWQIMDGVAVRSRYISAVWDNGDEIIVSVLGRLAPIRISYAEARRVFRDWDDITIVPSTKQQKKKHKRPEAQ